MASQPLLDLLTAPWAIEPSKLREMQAVYATHLRGEAIDIDAIEARLGRPLASEQQEYSIQAGGIATLAIEGVLAPKANMFTRVSGGSSAQMLSRQVESAIADPRVKGLLLVIDSPGGSVFGSPELAQTIRTLAAEKPIVAVTDGTMASAAYWVGSAANAVYATGPTTHVGSIGVVATHEYSPRGAGSQVTEITAGRYKRMASDSQPLNEEGRAYIQDRVDTIYGAFVDTVAANRGVSVEQVLEHMADGKVFVGQQALDAGLIDGFASVGDLVDQMAANPQAFMRRRTARLPAPPKRRTAVSANIAPLFALSSFTPAADSGTSPQEDPPMPITREQIQADAPDLLAALQAEGAAAERQRIQDVRAQSLPGHEALVEQLAMDGVTTGAQAAMAVLAAERAACSQRGRDILADTFAPLPGAASEIAEADITAPAAAGPASSPIDNARGLADRIATKQAEAAQRGRPISAAAALAAINKESAA